MGFRLLAFCVVDPLDRGLVGVDVWDRELSLWFWTFEFFLVRYNIETGVIGVILVFVEVYVYLI